METSWVDPDSWEYHKSQYQSPKRSTIWALKVLEEKVKTSEFVIDIGCGGGGVTTSFAEKFPNVNFLGVDNEKELISFATQENNRLRLKNLRFEVADISNLKGLGNRDGALLIQTISWLPDYKQALISIFENLSPRWLFMTGLFYQGEISVMALVTELKKGRRVFYNTYSIPDVIRFSLDYDYKAEIFPFSIDIDIPKPADTDKMSTYTVTSKEDSNRHQISGPLLLHWHGILLEKIQKSA